MINRKLAFSWQIIKRFKFDQVFNGTVNSTDGKQMSHKTNNKEANSYLQLRAEFLQKTKLWESTIDLSRLTEDEKEIHFLHKEACEAFKFTYVDPKTGLKVFTRYRHFLRGKCCGTGCRHCPFEHIAVDEARKSLKIFNSAFYIPICEDNEMEE